MMKIKKKELVKLIKEQTQKERNPNELLNDVVYFFGREYGKGRRHGENTVGGRLMDEITTYLKKHNVSGSWKSISKIKYWDGKD